MHVLISGGGIAGPALAWWLAKSGARVTVVEKAPAILPHGQNIDISGSARTVIKRMGLREKIMELNTTEKGAQFIDPQGRAFAPFPVREGSAASLTNEWEILRGDLALVLYEATKELENVEYHLGTTVASVVSNDDQSVTVELSNGTTQNYDLLVAADGQWSRLRTQNFPAESVTVIDKNMYVVYFTIPRLRTDNNWWNIYHALGSRIITLRPDPHGTTRAMFTYMPCNEAQKKLWLDASKGDRQSQEDLVRRHFAGAGWETQRLLDSMAEAPDFYFQAIQQIRMSTWSNGSIVCLGDAAYAPTPLTGMGTSLAIVGAYVLAGELGKVQNAGHPAGALEGYEKIFRPFVEETQKVPSMFPGIVHPETAFRRWLFQMVMSAISKITTLVVGLGWLLGRVGKNNDDDDFTLPQYPEFDRLSYGYLSSVEG